MARKKRKQSDDEPIELRRDCKACGHTIHVGDILTSPVGFTFYYCANCFTIESAGIEHWNMEPELVDFNSQPDFVLTSDIYVYVSDGLIRFMDDLKAIKHFDLTFSAHHYVAALYFMLKHAVDEAIERHDRIQRRLQEPNG